MGVDDFIVIQRRKPGPRPMTCEKRTIRAVVANGRMVDVFDALCLVEGRRPHQLVHDIVLDRLREAEKDPAIRQLVNARLRHQSPLRLVAGGESDE